MINFDAQVADIRAKHSYLDPECLPLFAAIHGAVIGVDCNDAGVFKGGELVVIGDEQSTCRGEIRLNKTPKGHWVMATNLSINYSGKGGSPSVFICEGYETKEEAIEAGLDSLAYSARRLKADATTYAEGYKKYGDCMIAAIDQYRTDKNQLTLF